MGESTDSPSKHSGPQRRALVAGGLAGVVGAALARMPSAAAQGDDVGIDQPLFLGGENVADSTTGLEHSGPGPTFQVANPGDGAGVQVVTNRGPAVSGLSPGGGLIGSTVGFTETMPTAAGVQGTGRRVGVAGAVLPSDVVITGTQSLSAGVWGSAPILPANEPFTMTYAGPFGVAGTAFGAEQVAVVAHNPFGVALSVVGGLQVSCGGHGVFDRQARTAEISDGQITSDSVLLVTLAADPGNRGASIQYVEADEGSASVHLTAPVARDTPFTYLCFDLDG